MKKVTFISEHKRQIIDITEEVQKNIPPDASGLINLFVSHTSAAISTADLDPGTDLDYLDAFEKIIPQLNYRHYHDPKHTPDHILSTMIGISISIPFEKGKLILGTWQKIILVELNGPKTRNIMINILTSD